MRWRELPSQDKSAYPMECWPACDKMSMCCAKQADRMLCMDISIIALCHIRRCGRRQPPGPPGTHGRINHQCICTLQTYLRHRSSHKQARRALAAAARTHVRCCKQKQHLEAYLDQAAVYHAQLQDSTQQSNTAHKEEVRQLRVYHAAEMQGCQGQLLHLVQWLEQGISQLKTSHATELQNSNSRARQSEAAHQAESRQLKALHAAELREVQQRLDVYRATVHAAVTVLVSQVGLPWIHRQVHTPCNLCSCF